MHMPQGPADTTHDEMAEHLLRQIRFCRRHGTPSMKASAAKWEMLVRTHAEPAEEVQAVNFAQAMQEAQP